MHSISSIYIKPARSKEAQEVPSAILQSLLDTQQDGILPGAFWRANFHSISQLNKCMHGVLCVIVIPWHVIIIKEREQFILILLYSLFKRRSNFCLAFK